MGRSPKHSEHRAIQATATEWAVRRKDTEGWSDADSAALEGWLDASELHRTEFEKAAYALEQMNDRRAFDASEVSQILEKRSRKQRKIIPMWGYGVMAAAAIIAVVLGLALFPQGQTFTTEIAQIESRVLEDGTQVTMDAGTRIQLLFNDDERKIVVYTGSIVFDVNNGDSRPFSVEAGESLIRDIGTIFSVSLREDLNGGGAERVKVAVEEGIVEVYHKRETDQPLARLEAGEQALYQPMVEEKPVALTKQSQAPFAAWRKRQLHYRNQPLGEVLADLQRHYTGEIRLTDSSLGALTVSGTITTERFENAIRALEEILPLQITEFSERRIVIEPAAF